MSRHRIRLERSDDRTDFVVYHWEIGEPDIASGGERRRTRLGVFPNFELAQQAYPDAIAALWEPK